MWVARHALLDLHLQITLNSKILYDFYFFLIFF